MARRKRRRRRPALYTPVAVLLVIFLSIFGISVFFKINQIAVSGNARYGADEIVAASGIVRGDNLMLLDRGAAAIRIRGAMPYVRDVRVAGKIPDRVIIEVTESIPVACVGVDGDRYIIDKTARILEKTNAAGAAGLLQVQGVVPLQPEVGRGLPVGEAGQSSLIALTEVLSAMEETELYKAAQSLDVSNISKITFIYDGRITVELGSPDNISDKLLSLLSVVAQQEAGAEGTVKFTADGKTRFIPKGSV